MDAHKILGFCILMGCVLAGLSGCGGASEDSTAPASGEASAQEGPPLGDFQDDYEQMVARLDLTAEESATLEAAWQQHLAQLEDWWAQHGASLVAYEAELKQAASDSDLSDVRAAKAKADPLRKEFRALGRDGEVKVVMALSQEKRKAWDAEQLIMKLEGLIAGRIELSDAQSASAKALAQEYAAYANPDLAVQNRLAQSFLDFERELEKTVLTPDQRAIYEQMKDENKMRSLGW